MGAFAASHGCTGRDAKPIRQGGFDRRRLLLAAGGGLVCALAGLRPAAAGELPKGAVDRTFDIFRKGERIGGNRVVFRPTGSGFEVVTEIDIAVKMAFITAYRYRQEANDRWQNGVLVASDVATDDNGERTRVRIREAAGRLKGEGPEGPLDLRLGILTDLCWWNPAIVRHDQLLDAQRGTIDKMALKDGEREIIRVAGQAVEASRYTLAASRGREGHIWYDAEGRWVQAVIRTRGELIEFRLAA